MTIYIGHTTAALYWERALFRPKVREHRISEKECYVRKCDVVSAIDKLSLCALIDIVLLKSKNRGKRGFAKFHVDKKAPATKKFVRIDYDLYISSPETCFLEAASSMSKYDLIRLAFSLCGTYAISQEGLLQKREQLTTVSKLRKYVLSCPRTESAKKALSALRYTLDGSASPMETNVAMALCLRRKMGGYGISLPEMNVRVAAKQNQMVNRSHFVCDLFWKKHSLAVEYDSITFHKTEGKQCSDSARRAGLISCGIQVVSLTTQQFFNRRWFDEFARAISKLTGKRLKKNDFDFSLSQNNFYKSIKFSPA